MASRHPLGMAAVGYLMPPRPLARGGKRFSHLVLSISTLDRTPFMGPPVVRVGGCVGLAS